MARSNATVRGLLLVTLLGVGCGGGSSFTGYTGGAGGMVGTAGAGTAGTNPGTAGYGTAGYDGAPGTAGTGYSTAGYAGDVIIAGAAGTAGYAGDVIIAGSAGIAGSYGTGGYDGAPGTAGMAGAGTAGAGTSGAAGMAGAAGTSSDPCASLMAQASSALTAATECNPFADALQCTGIVQGLCGCDVSVNFKDSPATQAYLNYQKQIFMMGCVQACPDILCQVFTSGSCQSNMNSSLGGTCRGMSGATL